MPPAPDHVVRWRPPGRRARYASAVIDLRSPGGVAPAWARDKAKAIRFSRRVAARIAGQFTDCEAVKLEA